MNIAQYVGIPFAEQGSDREGCHCGGLIQLIYKEQFDIEIEGFSGCAKDHDQAALFLNHQEHSRCWKRIEEPVFGAVVLMNIRGLPIHLGMAISQTHMIHVLRGANAVIEPFNTGKYANRIRGFFKYDRGE